MKCLPVNFIVLSRIEAEHDPRATKTSFAMQSYWVKLSGFQALHAVCSALFQEVLCQCLRRHAAIIKREGSHLYVPLLECTQVLIFAGTLKAIVELEDQFDAEQPHELYEMSASHDC